MSAWARAIYRGTVSIVLFGLFGLGALLLAPLMLILRKPEYGQPVVRAAWRLLTFFFVLTRLVRIERGNLAPIAGSVIAASHPSLVDVVLLVSLVPRTLYVAKRALRRNPFLSAIVRATALPDDATLPERAAAYLKDGWNVLIFPEGTRSPAEGGLQPLHRGAAQLALRTGAPLACVRIDVSRRSLGKGQKPWDVGDRVVTYSFGMDVIPPRRTETASLRSAAAKLTEEMRTRLSARVLV